MSVFQQLTEQAAQNAARDNGDGIDDGAESEHDIFFFPKYFVHYITAGGHLQSICGK